MSSNPIIKFTVLYTKSHEKEKEEGRIHHIPGQEASRRFIKKKEGGGEEDFYKYLTPFHLLPRRYHALRALKKV